MKLLVYSDLHLEESTFEPDAAAVQAADVIVLAGDIHTAPDGILWARKTFGDKAIVYVAGNHELYGGEWTRTLDLMRKAAHENDVHFLENDSVEISGHRFLGCSLWTDFEYFGKALKRDNMRFAMEAMPDYLHIAALESGHENCLTPELTVERHRQSLKWLKSELQTGDPGKTIVVTHHCPDSRSVFKQYASEPLTAAFASRLPHELLVKTRLWLHGHTHHPCDYRIGDSKAFTRVICNPRGVPHLWFGDEYDNPKFNSSLVLSQTNSGDWRPV